MDRVYKEERNYILNMVKKVKASGCNVLLIQKSILRDAVTDLSLHYLVSQPSGLRGTVMLVMLVQHESLNKPQTLVWTVLESMHLLCNVSSHCTMFVY